MVSMLITACGGGGGSGGSSNNTAALASPSVVALLAGNVGGIGNLDGTGAAASFNLTNTVATDSVGNVYVADSRNQVIRKITPAGVVTTLAGTGVVGHADGVGTAASFNYPYGVATDSAGNVYVTDTSNSIIRKITPTGLVTTLAGVAQVIGHADGTGTAASFAYPTGIATDSTGNIYVADASNHTIRKITPAGVVTTVAGVAGVPGHADGVGTAASFNYPGGVATDSMGNIYVADTSNHTIRKITPARVVTTLAGTATVAGFADGVGTAASFNYPYGVATDSAGDVYVADTLNNAIRKITPAGVVTTLAGTGTAGHADGTGAAASFNRPNGVATDGAGNIYVADTNNSIIRNITPTGVVTTLAGTAGVIGHADSVGTGASFAYPTGIATDSVGNIYVADSNNQTIRKITPTGLVTTLAGTAGVTGGTDGTGAAASFAYPGGVATDSAGNIYVADTSNSTIRKITPAGVVTTLAGTGTAGYADGTGAAASFNNPYGVATDSAGDVYVADTFNSTIRKITPAGVVTTLAGTGTAGHADGVGTTASFSYPDGVATDGAGNIYVADTGNKVIRKITPAGLVTTLAGTAGVLGSADGVGPAASFNFPHGVVTDSAGDVYVTDTFNSTIRKITSAGVVTTVVGSNVLYGFIAGSLPGVISAPYGLALTGNTLYFSMNNGIVQVVNLP